MGPELPPSAMVSLTTAYQTPVTQIPSLRAKIVTAKEMNDPFPHKPTCSTYFPFSNNMGLASTNTTKAAVTMMTKNDDKE